MSGMPRKARWPDRQTRLDNIEKGTLDHSEDAISFLDLEPWEIRGEPPPSRAGGQRDEPKPEPAPQ